MQCEHEHLELIDKSATRDDIELLPDAFLRNQGRCQEEAMHVLKQTDDLGEDSMSYCTEHMILAVTGYIRMNQVYAEMIPLEMMRP